jgi:hypothetical protein
MENKQMLCEPASMRLPGLLNNVLLKKALKITKKPLKF